MSETDFTWVDGERLLRYGTGALADGPRLLTDRGFDGYALLTTERAAAEERTRFLVDGADVVLQVASGGVADAAAAILDDVGDRPVVALGGGRVVDAGKAIGGATGASVAAVPTTLAGSPFTRVHRLPTGAQGQLVRPSLVLADPELMASAPMPGLAATAMNSLAHAAESLWVPLANPVAEMAALQAASLYSTGFANPEHPVKHNLALGALLGSYAIGTTGFAIHHITCQTLVAIAGTPHARTNAVMLPHSVAFVETRAPEPVARLRAALGGTPVAELAALSGATTLTDLGMDRDAIDAVLDAVDQRPDLANTPGGKPSRDEMRAFVEGAL